MDAQSTVSPRQLLWLKPFQRWFERNAQAYARAAFLFTSIAWLVYSAAHTIQKIADYYTPLPMWDYWRVVFNLHEYQAFHLGVFWMQHNEHRIIFPELVFAADMLWWHGRIILPLIVSFLCYLATFAILFLPIYKDRRLTKFECSAAVALAGIIVFWEGATSVLAAPFLLPWPMMQFATACSLAFLVRMEKAESSLPLLGTVIAATVATYSLGNGLILWPLLIVLALFLRLGRTQFLILAASAIVDLTLYFVGYRSLGSVNLRNFFIHPIYSLQFIASYLSMPFGGMENPSFGVAAGLLSMAGTAILFLIAVRRRLHLLPPVFVLFSYYAFTLLAALMTAAGRMGPGDPQFGGAKASRYVTVPQMHWGVVIVLSLWILWSIPAAKRAGNLLALVFAILLFIYLHKLAPWLKQTTDFFAEQQMATLSVEDGLMNKSLLSKIHPDLPTVSTGLAILQKSRLSIYSRRRDRWLGQPMRRFSSIRDSMPGAITHVAPIESGLQVTGWADLTKWKSPYQWVVLADESGVIVGFGSHFPAGFPVAARSPINPSAFGWVGFISNQWRPKTISAYIVSPRRDGLFSLVYSINVPPAIQ